MFGQQNYDIKNIGAISKELFAGGDKPKDFSLQCNDNYKYPVYSNGKNGNDLLCYSKKYKVDVPALTISARGTIGYTAIRPPFFTPVVRLITLIPRDEVNLRYLQYCVDEISFTKSGSGAGQLTVPDFAKYEIMVPPKSLQLEFENYAVTCDKLKFEAQERLGELNTARGELIDKYFR